MYKFLLCTKINKTIQSFAFCFSRNLSQNFSALFFACEARTKEKGRIIAVNIANLKTTKIDYKKNKEKIFKEDILAEPTGKNPRVIFQSSVFVHPYKGYLEKEQYTSFIIEARLKEKILEYLKKFCNITTKSIYNDLHGFIEEQKNHSTAEIEFYRGLTLQDEEEWREAVVYYGKSIKLNPQNETAYNNRGSAKFSLKQYNEAIEDFTTKQLVKSSMRKPITTEAMQKIVSNNTTKP